MIVNLGQRIAVAAAPLPAQPVGLDDPLVDLGRGVGHPLEERRAEIEADPGIVVQEVDDPPLAVEQPRARVGGVALAGDPLVPVVEGGGGVLDLDDVEPGILARRLVEVAVDADIAGMAHALTGFLGVRRARRELRRSDQDNSSGASDQRPPREGEVADGRDDRFGRRAWPRPATTSPRSAWLVRIRPRATGHPREPARRRPT